MNKFVNYLKSLNNASGDNENAIAENQYNDKNQFYKKLAVQRKITENIIQEIQQGQPQVFFLTGHAGDGKTSILLQAIDELILNQDTFHLKKFDVVDLVNNKKLHYVKDVSELPKEQQIERSRKAISLAKDNSISSVVISNTGQLLDLFLEYGFKENEFLDFIDSNKGKKTVIDGVDVSIINIALCDNTDFVRKFIQNIIKDELWLECKSCKNGSMCPTYLNMQLLSKYEKQVSMFITNYYRWNSEHNNRATIRQMVGHISYAITGNINCIRIHNHNVVQMKYFHNNFANLFFGYKKTKNGLVLDSKAKNIAGIRAIQHEKLDDKKLSIEYDIFIKEKFNGIVPELQPYAEYLWKEYRVAGDKKDISMINAIKRAYMMFNTKNESELEVLYKELYSDVFPYYIKLRNNESDKMELRKIEGIVFDALFKLFTGFPTFNQEKLYLTLKQNGDKVQNVQVIQGYIYKENIVVRERSEKNIATGQNYRHLELVFNERESIVLNYRMLEFLLEINSGIVQTEIDPMLSQGIDNIKIALKKTMRKYSKDELALLVYTGEKIKVKRLSINRDYLEVTS